MISIEFLSGCSEILVVVWDIQDGRAIFNRELNEVHGTAGDLPRSPRMRCDNYCVFDGWTVCLRYGLLRDNSMREGTRDVNDDPKAPGTGTRFEWSR